MSERTLRRARIVSIIAATAIALACGTNYAYSAWAPQFADRMNLSATQSNLIGNFGNIGMYATGIPVGYLVDGKGPKYAVAIGALCLGGGYLPLQRAYDSGPGSVGIAMLCFFSFLTGVGSCSAFSAAIKTSAMNWPHHRGTATAFPLSAFGLSALFFTTLAGFAFPDNTSDYLLVLSIGTFSLVFVSNFFLKIYPHPQTYAKLASDEESSTHSQPEIRKLHRTRSSSSKPRSRSLAEEPSKRTLRSSSHLEASANMTVAGEEVAPVENSDPAADESSSLMSKSSASDNAQEDEAIKHQDHHLRKPDITGPALLRQVEFYQLFLLMGLLTGVGLMTINNIGNDAQALWTRFDPTLPKGFIQKRQLIHVSVISSASFVGRILSGIGSDLLLKRLHASRFWCVVVSALVFFCSQIVALHLNNPHHLYLLSSLTGLGYGALFGVYPALVADAFGVHGLSLNWGFMILAPVVSGNVFNLAYGRIFDAHSKVGQNGERICKEGLDCYRDAYVATSVSCAVGVLMALYCVWHDYREKKRLLGEDRRESSAHGHDA